MAGAALVIVAAASLSAVDFLAYATAEDLRATQADLAATRSELSATVALLTSTQSVLSTTRDQLTATQTDLRSEQARRVAADQKVTQLESAVQKQSDCITALKGNVDEANRIRRVMAANFDTTATGSRWAIARAEWLRLVNSALDNYFEAYRAAYVGSRALANSYIDLGNSAIDRAAAQVSIMNAEISTINATTRQIGIAVGGLSAELERTQAVCGF